MNPIAQKALDNSRAFEKQPSLPARRKTSREADKFVVRLPDDLRPRVKAAAENSHSSMNTIVIEALRQYLDGQRKQELLLDALELALTQQPARVAELEAAGTYFHGMATGEISDVCGEWERQEAVLFPEAISGENR